MKAALLGAGHIRQTIAPLVQGSGNGGVTVYAEDRKALAKLEAEVIAVRAAKLPHPGLIAQEQVRLPDFLANWFGVAVVQFGRIESIA